MMQRLNIALLLVKSNSGQVLGVQHLTILTCLLVLSLSHWQHYKSLESKLKHSRQSQSSNDMAGDADQGGIARKYKKLHKNTVADIDDAIENVSQAPKSGLRKKVIFQYLMYISLLVTGKNTCLVTR
jgi:hypothetical protein